MNRRGPAKDPAEEFSQIVLRLFGFHKLKVWSHLRLGQAYGVTRMDGADRLACRLPERVSLNAFPREWRNEEETVSAIRRERENQPVRARGNNSALRDSGDKRNALQTFRNE